MNYQKSVLDDDQLLSFSLNNEIDSYKKLSQQIDNFDKSKTLYQRAKNNDYLEYAKLNHNSIITDEKMAAAKSSEAARNLKSVEILSEITNQQNIMPKQKQQNSPKFSAKQIGQQDQENVSHSFLKIKEISETIQSSIQNLNNLLTKAKNTIGTADTLVSKTSSNSLNEYFNKLVQSQHSTNNQQQDKENNNTESYDIFRNTKSCAKFFDDDHQALKKNKPQSVSFKAMNQPENYEKDEQNEDFDFPINPNFETSNQAQIPMQNSYTTQNSDQPFYSNLFSVDKNSKKIYKSNINGLNQQTQKTSQYQSNLRGKQSQKPNTFSLQSQQQQQKISRQPQSQIKNYHLFQNKIPTQQVNARSQQVFSQQNQNQVRQQQQQQQNVNINNNLIKNKMSVGKFNIGSTTQQQSTQRGKISVNKFAQSQNPKASLRKFYF